jgi:CRP-like cAMP-binding protein
VALSYDGRCLDFTEIKPGNFVGEISLFQEGRLRTADVISSSNDTLIAIYPFDEFNRLQVYI